MNYNYCPTESAANDSVTPVCIKPSEQFGAQSVLHWQGCRPKADTVQL